VYGSDGLIPAEENTKTRRYLLPCQFVHRKFHIDWPRIKLGPPACKLGILSPETNRAIFVYLFTIDNSARSFCELNVGL
jgi:hypothetical protein